MNLKTSVVFAAAGDDLFEQMSRANRPAVADPLGIPATTEENMQQGQQHQQQQQQATTTKGMSLRLFGNLSKSLVHRFKAGSHVMFAFGTAYQERVEFLSASYKRKH